MVDEAKKNRPKILDELDKITELLPVPIYWEDVNSIMLGANQQVFKESGSIKKEAYIGKNLYELYPQEMAEHIKKHNEAVMRTGEISSQEERIQDITTGEVKYYTAVKGPLYDENGTIIGVIGTSINITEKKIAEEQLRLAKEKAEAANEAKESFLRNMRHDLRTPFSGILTLAQLLADDETDTEKRINLQHVADSARVLLSYMNTILDHAQLGTQTLAIIKAPVQLKKLLHESLLTITPTAALKDIQLHEHYADNMPHTILSDAWRLQRIIMNLLGNAVKFTDRGTISIGVDVISETTEQITLAVWVQDTGIGIPENKYENIFEKFTRLEMAYSGKYAGTGLGLYDVKQLCDDLEGKITVKSKLKKGSLFTCTFTFDKVSTLENDASDTPNKTTLEKNLHIVENISVLLVEDQPIAMMSAARMLRSRGYLVDIAETGFAALEKFTDKKYDIILMDIGLPDIDGIQVASKIRQLETANLIAKTPIIAVTAHPDNSENELTIFDKVCGKPFSLTVLEEMNNILNTR